MSELVLYSTVWCGYCQRLKNQLAREGIPFRVVDIENEPEAEAFVKSVNGGNALVPTIRFPDGGALGNPSLRDVKHRLAKAS